MGGRVCAALLLLLVVVRLLLLLLLLLLEHDLHAEGLLPLLLFVGPVSDARLDVELVDGASEAAARDHEVVAPVACQGGREGGREGSLSTRSSRLDADRDISYPSYFSSFRLSLQPSLPFFLWCVLLTLDLPFLSDDTPQTV